MGRKYVPVLMNNISKKIYMDDVTFVYKRRIRKGLKPIPPFEKTSPKILRK